MLDLKMNYYSEIDKGPSDFKVVQHMYEAGIKLEIRQLTTCSAVLIYHQFYKAVHDGCDKYVIAATSIFVAGKLEDEPVQLRDIINVFQKLVNKNSDPVNYDHYQLLRESIARCELLIMRTLKFNINTDSPHRYLFHYLKALSDWFDEKTMAEIPIARTTWSLLTDFYHDPVCIKHSPKHIAVAIIYMTLQIYGTTVPCENEASVPWYKVLCKDLTVENIWDIMLDVTNVYEKEEKE